MNQLHFLTEQTAPGVDLIDPHLETLQLLLSGARVLAGERHGGSHHDILGLGGCRENNKNENNGKQGRQQISAIHDELLLKSPPPRLESRLPLPYHRGKTDKNPILIVGAGSGV